MGLFQQPISPIQLAELNMLADPSAVGEEIHRFISQLYPICRSITGDGLRRTLRMIGEHIPLTIHEVPSGTQVFDWIVPKEWNIRDAYIKNSRGERIVDFNTSNLHVLNYSVPVKARMRLRELREHLFTIPNQPDWIPYRTSYYKERWGFCVSYKQFSGLQDDEYEICIDTTLSDGHLTYGEYNLKGQSQDEILVSCHACHPSLCNDNLSGVAIATRLAQYLSGLSLRYSYTFLFLPGTIGSITWLALNEDRTQRIRHGMVLACLGDSGPSTYKKSRRGDAEIDRAVSHILKHSSLEHQILEFSPYGYDERQYCSPAFDLPVGCLSRTPFGRFPEYHTSADNLDFVQPAALADSFAKCVAVLELLEHNETYLNQNPKCEPQLGRRGLYGPLGGGGGTDSELAMLWVLNLSDGNHSLLDIAERSGLGFTSIRKAADLLVEHRLLSEKLPSHADLRPHSI
jgi:aminopeptidase-like protein